MGVPSCRLLSSLRFSIITLALTSKTMTSIFGCPVKDDKVALKFSNNTAHRMFDEFYNANYFYVNIFNFYTWLKVQPCHSVQFTVISAFPSFTHPTTISAPIIDPLGEIPIPIHPVVFPCSCYDKDISYDQFNTYQESSRDGKLLSPQYM